MKEKKHIAVYTSGRSNKETILHQIENGQLLKDIVDIDLSTTALYSGIAVTHLIDEETRHDLFEIGSANRGLSTMSDGEKKKALLAHIISQRPSCIIVDNIFDSLDTASQATIADTLTTLSKDITIIQVTNRAHDILPFIQQIYTIINNKIELVENIQEHLKNDRIVFIHSIPPPLHAPFIEADPLVKFTNVSVNYDDRPIVKNINWQINKGEFWQLVGPNGSGKSTLLSMISGDNAKAYGQDIILFGKKKGSGETVWEIKEKIGYFSSAVANQFERLHSIENMIISGFFDSVGLYVKPTEVQIQLADEWLALLGLYDVKNKPFLNLSLAHQRLILIARAMVKHPPLLILDEPIAGLNDSDIGLVIALINKMAEESDTTIIYVSHRSEPGSSPKNIFKLMPTAEGSIGS